MSYRNRGTLEESCLRYQKDCRGPHNCLYRLQRYKHYTKCYKCYGYNIQILPYGWHDPPGRTFMDTPNNARPPRERCQASTGTTEDFEEARGRVVEVVGQVTLQGLMGKRQLGGQVAFGFGVQLQEVRRLHV